MNNQTSMSDEKLIQFYLNGYPNAMATLVELYKDRVYRYIYNMVHDKQTAEELFQQVFISLINNMISGKLTDDGNFLLWATRVAQQLCIEHSRKTKLSVLINSASEEEALGFSIPIASANVNYHDSHGKIKSMIDLLPDTQREVLTLSHYGGLSFKEIAEIMKCTLTAALENMKYGLNNLREMMTEKEMMLN